MVQPGKRRQKRRDTGNYFSDFLGVPSIHPDYLIVTVVEASDVIVWKQVRTVPEDSK